MLTYEEVVSAIENIPKFLEAPSVEHTRSVLDAIGSPDEGMKIVHVAGTNGKGSTCAFVTRMLKALGYRVGTFTSPHLIRINERIQVDQIPVSDEEFVRSYEFVQKKCKDLGAMNYFECLFAMCMDIFARENLDYVVLEVGMGGRMDGTNAIKDPVCCAITSISFDHVEVLGRTIPEIAAAKAGIIKPGAKVVYDATNLEANDVIRTEAALYDDPAIGIDNSWYQDPKVENGCLTIQVLKGALAGRPLKIPFIAQYQAINSLLAITIMEELGLLESEEQKQIACDGLLMTKWPGRMQQVLPGVYIDGAHNEDGIGRFVQAVNDVECKGRKLLLFSAVKEKDVQMMAKHIGKETSFSHIMITEIENSRQLGAEVLVDAIKQWYSGPIETCHGIDIAFEKALEEKGEDDILFIAGSLYLAGTIMDLIEKKENIDIVP